MIDKTKYENLIPFQGTQLKNIDFHAIIDAVIEAGRNDDIENLPIELSNDKNRLNEQYLSFDYYGDEENEFITIQTDSGRFEIPIEENKDGINYAMFDRRIRNTVREYGEEEIYIDMNYLMDIEAEMVYEEETIIEPEETVEPELKKEENEPMEESKEIINAKRTLMENNTYFEFNNIAEKLQDAGYNVRTQRGGSLVVTDPHLEDNNTITITKKGAYIERAELTTDLEKDTFNKMRNQIEKEMKDNISFNMNKYQIMENSTMLSDSSSYSLTREMMCKIEELGDVNLSKVFEAPELKHSYKDKDGKDYLSLELGYHVQEDKTIIPIITAKYGKDYGDISRTFEVSKQDLEDFKKGNFHNSKIRNDLDMFISIGNKDRGSLYEEIKKENYLNKIEKSANQFFKKEFKNLKQDKIDYFVNATKEYYKEDLSQTMKPFKDYMIDKMIEAPFYRESMLKGENKEKFEALFRKAERQIDKPELPKSKNHFNIDLDALSHTVEEKGVITYDSEIKEPFVCDKKWLETLGRLQDNIENFYNDYVIGSIKNAKELGNTILEIGEGIIKPDGRYGNFVTGGQDFIIFGGISSIKEGLNFGRIIAEMERTYNNLIKENESSSKLAAIDKKMDIKLLREDILRNANIYVKSAMQIKLSLERMLDSIKTLKDSIVLGKQNQQMNNTQTEIKQLNNKVVQNFKNMVHSSHQMSKDFKDLGIQGVNNLEAKMSYGFNEFKDGYNNIVKDAMVTLSAKEYSKNRIAEIMNDTRIDQSFKGIDTSEFANMLKAKYWRELPNIISAGNDASRIPAEERTDKDLEIIRQGEQARKQMEQNKFISEQINKQLKNTILTDKTMTKDKAILVLAEKYHNAAMGYNMMTGASSVKSYQDLSNSEKEMCKEIINEVLNNMPHITDKLERNEQNLIKENTKEVSEKTKDEDVR